MPRSARYAELRITAFRFLGRSCEHRLVTTAGDGIALSRSYFEELVAPLLKRHLPDVRYAAARVGPGSDVLGLDDALSRDHDWGLRLQLFVRDADRARVLAALDKRLPTASVGTPFGLSSRRTRRRVFGSTWPA